MRVELLVLIPGAESFCMSKKALVEFLKVDALIEISGQKISYKRTLKSKEIVSAKFRIDTDLVKSKQERYFTLTLEISEDANLDEFNELCDRLRSIIERIVPGKTTINTLWDDIGRAYAEKSYPLINEVENLMRRLIAKFMLINVGVNWSKDTINQDLVKKINSFGEDEPHTNDLFKLDFIHLKEVLFEKKRDISLDELDRILSKTVFSASDQELIRRYMPRSNWEKYFSTLIDEPEHSIDTKWELLYKLRNKVAHNRNVKKEDFEKIKGLCGGLKSILASASAKLGEIDIDEADRDLLIFSYGTESHQILALLSERAVADYYSKLGYMIDFPRLNDFDVDFVASVHGESIGVEVKFFRAELPLSAMRSIIRKQSQQVQYALAKNGFDRCHAVIVFKGGGDARSEAIVELLSSITEELDPRIEFKICRLDEYESLGLYQEVILAHNL
ncbi:hypothetical protein [Pseudomonas sp. NPDC096950]|uniref:hypothetical protein n=1 Tax=Pseudomonas sp. NPDC096950 TaxID=3364485 RepID=UPI00383B3699